MKSEPNIFDIIKIHRLTVNDYWEYFVVPFLESQQPNDIDIVIDKLFDQSQSLLDHLKDTRDFAVALLHGDLDHDVNEVFKAARRHRQHAPDLVVLFRIFAFGGNLVCDNDRLAALHAEPAQHALKHHLIRREIFGRRLGQRISRALAHGSGA